MANAYLKNFRPNTYGEVISAMVELLVSAGWTYKSSGSGVGGTFNAAGKVFSTTGTGATGWANAGAWARIADPGGRREFVFGHDNVGGLRIKYSALDKFIATSGSANGTPVATDERYLKGGGPDSSSAVYNGNGGASFGTANQFGSGGTVSYYGAAMGTAPYGFWICGTQLSGATRARYASLMMDPVTSVAEDTDPVVFSVGSTSGFNSAGRSTPYSVDPSPANGVFGRDMSTANGFLWGYPAATRVDPAWDGSFGQMAPKITATSATFGLVIGTPMVVNWTNHPLHPGYHVIFTTTGTLPTGLSPWTIYYVSSVGIAQHSFQLTDDPVTGTSSFNTSGSQSGTHTLYAGAFFYVQPAGFSLGGNVMHGPTTTAVNPFNGNPDSLPMLYTRMASADSLPGIKGWSTLARWCTTPRNHLVDTTDNRTRICVGAVWLPWDGSQPVG